MRVRIVKETVMSGRGGFPSLGYRAVLVNVDTFETVARTGTTCGLRPYEWRTRGETLAKRRHWEIVP